MPSGNLYLTGFMGAGKTTLGQGLAKLLGRRFVDLDQLIAKRQGQSVPELFASRGEAAFRELEAAELHRVSRRQRLVVGTGGGLPVDGANRHLMRASGRIVCLQAGLETCRDHLGPQGVQGRPLWRDASALEALYAGRQTAYADCDLCLAVDGLSPAAALEALAAKLLPDDSLSLTMGAATCQVVSAWDAPAALTAFSAGRRVVVITDRHLETRHLPRYLAGAGLADATRIVLAPGEGSKSLASAKRVYEALAAARVERGDLVVGLGGGVVTDLTGFVASTFKRGLEFVLCATSLVACVDAAVGGKTGVNLPAGKNLVGTFAAPLGVILDQRALGSLPRSQIAEGLAEAYKTGLVADPELARLSHDELAAMLGGDLPLLASAAWRSARAKAEVVGEDFREKGRRRILNLGHTYGHALESHNHYRISHGQAVAAGMMVMARVSQGRGLIPAELADDICATSAGLIRQKLAWPEAGAAWELMRNDKKNAGGRVVFVLLNGVGQPLVVDDLTQAELKAALKKINPPF